MTDDPFARPDVRALCEAVAAGDDPTAATVLADALEEQSADREAAVLRAGRVWVRPCHPTRDHRLKQRTRELSRWRIALGGKRGWIVCTVYRQGPSLTALLPGARERMARALAEAADRLAARAVKTQQEEG
jgi:hypothetical protein